MNNKLVFLFESLFINIFCNNYCSYGESCLNTCNICGKDYDYSNCNYYNLFCELNTGIKYYQEYEYKYIEYFTSNRALNDICGSSIITIDPKDNTQKEILKINKDNAQNFLVNKKLHCHYEFENDYYKDSDKNLSLIIEYKNDDNNNIQSNFMIIIMLYSGTNSAKIFDLKKDNIKHQELTELKYYSSFTLYIDVDTNNNIKDSITIFLQYEDNKKLSPIVILLIILGGLIFIILVILAISVIKSKLKKKQRQRTQRNNNPASNQEEIEKKEKIKKIQQLFETELVPIYYSKELDDREFNGCTICLEKYRDNASKICILACNHIFHYKCLFDWLINNKHWKCPICNLDLTHKVKFVSRSNKNVNVQRLTLNHGINTQASNELFSVNVNSNE